MTYTRSSRPLRPFYTSHILLVSILVCLLAPCRVSAHISLSDPLPINAPKNPNTQPGEADYDYTAPLSPSGSNFPCKNHHLTPQPAITTYTAGSSYTASLSGTATHTGGSCQFALSYDKGESFKVIKSVIGGCPLGGEYNFTIPEGAPGGEEVLFAWTWVNRVGNREFYMDCAWVAIEGPSSRQNAEGKAPLEELPGIYVANIESVNGCVTKEQEDVVFDEKIRGPDVEFGGGLDESTPSNVGEECAWGGAGAGAGGEQRISYSAAQPSDGEHADHTPEEHANHDSPPSSGGKPIIMAPGAARGPMEDHHDHDEEGPVSTAVLGVLAYPSTSSRPIVAPPPAGLGGDRKPHHQYRPIAIGEPHPIALAGYDLVFPTHDLPPPPQETDTYEYVDVTEACPSDDAVVVTVTASCTSEPEVTVTVIASKVTVTSGLKSSGSGSGKKTVTVRRSTVYSVISNAPSSARLPSVTTPVNCPPGQHIEYLSGGMRTCVPNSAGSSSWRTITSPKPNTSPSPSPPSPGPGGNGDGLAYASQSDLLPYLPCVPGTFLCTSTKEFLTCDQTALGGGGYGWTWLYPRPIPAGMRCAPNLVSGVGKGQMPGVRGGMHREDQYMRE
jgi:hypothetical protein